MAHTQAWGRGEFILCLFPILDRLSSRTSQEQWAACKRPGTKWSELSIFGQGWTCVLFFLHVFLLGFLVEETPCEHGENMQTPHRKAWEIAHLSQQRPMWESNLWPSCCEAAVQAVQATEPPCHHVQFSQIQFKQFDLSFLRHTSGSSGRPIECRSSFSCRPIGYSRSNPVNNGYLWQTNNWYSDIHQIIGKSAKSPTVGGFELYDKMVQNALWI